MSFNSIHFLLFFPIVFIIYYIIPKKIQHIWLLIASFYFYSSWNIKYSLLLVLSIVITYLSGQAIGSINNEAPHSTLRKKIIVFECVFFNIAVLLFFKYFNFLFENIQLLASHFRLQIPDLTLKFLLPIGISFYTFQSLGYIIDVYRGTTKPEKNFLRYALFVSFFPQLVAGPIERSNALLPQLNKTHSFNPNNLRDGLLTMAYGFFLKIVVADNIGYIINPIFANYNKYHGMMLIVAVVLFAFQIYCDFNGYSQIAIGSAKTLGVQLMKNFDSPFLSCSIGEFWKRWHISLGTWFKDYVYIPLGGSRVGKLRLMFNLFIVWIFNGLWHGANWTYIALGLINCFYLIVQRLTKNMRIKLYERLKINTTSFGWEWFSRFVTFTLFCFSLLFFRATNITEAILMLKKIITEFHLFFFLSNNLFFIFENAKTLFTVLTSLAIVFVVDWCNYKKISLKPLIFNQQIVFRWFFYFSIIIILLYWGAYAYNNETAQFIYFQF